MDNDRRLNNKLAKMEAWPSPLKQEAGVDDHREISCRCVDHTMGVNQEAAHLSWKQTDKGNTNKERKGRGRGKTLGKTPVATPTQDLFPPFHLLAV